MPEPRRRRELPPGWHDPREHYLDEAQLRAVESRNAGFTRLTKAEATTLFEAREAMEILGGRKPADLNRLAFHLRYRLIPIALPQGKQWGTWRDTPGTWEEVGMMLGISGKEARERAARHAKSFGFKLTECDALFPQVRAMKTL